MSFSMRKCWNVCLITAITLILSGCSAGMSGASECERLANMYWSEYQAYIDARAANGGIEDEAVMSHYYASGKYYLKFMEIGCENQGYSVDQNSNSSGNSSNSSNNSSNSGNSSEISQSYVCQNLGDIYSDYQNALEQWRDTSSGVPFEDIFSFSDDAANKARELAEQISNVGITWDSGSIVSGLITDFASNVDEILNSVNKNFFRPGRLS